MAECIHCGAPTILHVNGVPVCLECDAKHEQPKDLPNAYRRKGPGKEEIGHPKAPESLKVLKVSE